MNSRVTILLCLFLFAACESDLKIDTLSFPPKLAISASLDGGSGHFKLLLSEGNALADYAEPQPVDKEIIRNGEIRLFEDDRLILSESGPFDLSFIGAHTVFDENGLGTSVSTRHGFRFEKTDISTRPGSVYRLEIDVDGYTSVTSSMTMPAAPMVSASMDTDVQVRLMLTYRRKNGWGLYQGWDIDPFSWYEMNLWPVSIHLADPDPNTRNYFEMEIQRSQRETNGNTKYNYTITGPGIGVSDISILQDNPNIEAFEKGNADFNYADFYQFFSLMISDNTFSGKSASLTLYSEVERKNSYPWDNDPDIPIPPDLIEVIFHRTTTLYVKSIPTETFKYYRSQMIQSAGIGFYTEPVIIKGNVENGYGFFSVYNSKSITFLEYETVEYFSNY